MVILNLWFIEEFWKENFLKKCYRIWRAEVEKIFPNFFGIKCWNFENIFSRLQGSPDKRIAWTVRARIWDCFFGFVGYMNCDLHLFSKLFWKWVRESDSSDRIWKFPEYSFGALSSTMNSVGRSIWIKWIGFLLVVSR